MHRDVIVAICSAVAVFGALSYMTASSHHNDPSCVIEAYDTPAVPAPFLHGDDADAVPPPRQRMALSRMTD